MADNKLQKPFLKWVGGKTQIIDKILSKIPSEFDNYHEPFLGGGSVLLAILSLQKQNKLVIKNKLFAYDFNLALINVYKHIQTHKEELYKNIACVIKEYDSLSGNLSGNAINRKPDTIDEARTSKESYYYWIRKQYNGCDKNTIESSALFMFLNKTCFRGMYREGPNGYNVPYGHYKKTPTIITETDLAIISDLIKDVEFIHSDFRDSIKNVKSGDFVYLDPPYAPENRTSFVGYVADGFDIDMHKRLFSDIKNMGHGIKFAMSNANVGLVTETFSEYAREDLVARRAINAKKPEATTTEVIIYN
jgi:DNA adenine methylase